MFSLGILWGIANLVYCPVAALTTIVGSSWFEVFIILAGGLLTLIGSIIAFRRRKPASRALLSGGILLLVLAIGGQTFLQETTHGVVNLLLLFLSGAIAVCLGLFGGITERKGWPALR